MSFLPTASRRTAIGIAFTWVRLYHRKYVVARPSLAWKIATANILLALFAVLLAGMLQYRKERRILAATMRQELTQVVTSGALLLDGETDGRVWRKAARRPPPRPLRKFSDPC